MNLGFIYPIRFEQDFQYLSDINVYYANALSKNKSSDYLYIHANSSIQSNSKIDIKTITKKDLSGCKILAGNIDIALLYNILPQGTLYYEIVNREACIDSSMFITEIVKTIRQRHVSGVVIMNASIPLVSHIFTMHPLTNYTKKVILLDPPNVLRADFDVCYNIPNLEYIITSYPILYGLGGLCYHPILGNIYGCSLPPNISEHSAYNNNYFKLIAIYNAMCFKGWANDETIKSFLTFIQEAIT